MDRLKIAFYGDDFTGSTDALEFLNRSGIRTMLFIDVPTPDQLSHYPYLQAIGVAGMSRTQSPQEMEKVLYPAFSALKALNPFHVHYKVCSTFDSSPAIGSIGKAIDIGAEVFKSSVIPLLVAAPLLGRYCLFGNLFAQMGIGSEGAIYRLDRHPSMSKHPVTPADESDLTLHLAKQTNKKISLYSIIELHKYKEQPQSFSFSKGEVVLFDALQEEDLNTIGEIIDKQTGSGHTVFSTGSSGIEMALGAYWQEKNTISWPINPLNTPILIASGSCSAVTCSQIKYAIAQGFAEISIDTITLANDINNSDLLIDKEIIDTYVLRVLEFLTVGKHVIIHTSLGNDDPRVSATAYVLKQKGIAKGNTAKLYGTLLGLIAKEVALQFSIQRIVIAGGDTSSYAARAMEIKAVEMIAPLSPGAPICRAHAPMSAIDKIEVVFKGGQVGKEDFFLSAAR